MKKFYWTVDNETETLTGEADTDAQAVADLAKKGYFLDDDGVELHERSDEELVAAARAEANPSEPKTSLQHLAELNTAMFEQLNTLKNRCALLETQAQRDALEVMRWKKNFVGSEMTLSNVASLAIAWNTEQHARLGTAHVEPPFIQLIRTWLTSSVPEKETPHGPESNAPAGNDAGDPAATAVLDREHAAPAADAGFPPEDDYV